MYDAFLLTGGATFASSLVTAKIRYQTPNKLWKLQDLYTVITYKSRIWGGCAAWLWNEAVTRCQGPWKHYPKKSCRWEDFAIRRTSPPLRLHISGSCQLSVSMVAEYDHHSAGATAPHRGVQRLDSPGCSVAPKLRPSMATSSPSPARLERILERWRAKP